MKVKNNYIDVLQALQESQIKLDLTKDIWYYVNGNPRCVLRVAKPNSFDSYADVVAKITLYYDNKMLWEVLITVDTDLEKFVEKLKKKISTVKTTRKDFGL